MAYKEEIIIEVNEKGIDEANAKLKSLKSNTEQAAEGHKNLGNSVLENGGAMGLLNDATGGLAMSIKDGVESLALFTKGSTIATSAQKLYTFVVGASTGGMKLFRLALAGTGIGLLVIGLGLLIANFDKVKKAVLTAVPGLALIGDVIGGLIDKVTDFVGVTSDASRALADMVAKSESSLKRNQDFLDANGDKYDQYTKKKIQANIDFNKKVIELNADEQLSESEKLEKIKLFRDKADREIIGADKDRNTEKQKIEKEQADKLADIAKAAKEKADAKLKEAADKEKARLDGITKINQDYANKLQDLNAQTDEEKRDLEEQRALKELENLNATEEEKKAVKEYYDKLSLDAYNLSIQQKAELDRNRTDAERQLVLDQKAWDIENEVDPLVKLEKEREQLDLQAEFDLEKLQYTIDTAEAESQAKLDAEIAYKKRKQQNENEITANTKAQAKTRTQIEQEAAKAKKDILLGAYGFAKDGIALLAGLDAENKELQKGALLATSALSIAEIIANTEKGSGVEVGTKGIFGLSTSAVLYAKSAISVASVLAATAKGLEGINASGGGGGGAGAPAGGGGGAPATPPPPPSFNLVQGTGANQIAQAVTGQNQPLQAYVVTSNVSTGQALDRNIIKNSKF